MKKIRPSMGFVFIVLIIVLCVIIGHDYFVCQGDQFLIPMGPLCGYGVVTVGP